MSEPLGEKVDLTVKDAAVELARRQAAKKSLIDYCKFMDPSYEPFDIHRLIARKLEDVEAGRLRRLALFVQPAIGKSRLSSELCPS